VPRYGYDIRVTGKISIEPPLSWPEIRDNPVVRGLEPVTRRNSRTARRNLDARVQVDEVEVDTPHGMLIRREGVAIVPSQNGAFAAYDLASDVELIASTFPDHAFRGYLECRSEEDVWRVIIRDGKATEVRPGAAWPHESEDVARKIATRIRAELVCCHIYERVNVAKELTLREAMDSPEWHDLCYWGEAAARLADEEAGQ
jgi:hypothetical protein